MHLIFEVRQHWISSYKNIWSIFLLLPPSFKWRLQTWWIFHGQKNTYNTGFYIQKSLGKEGKWQEGDVRTVLLRSLWQRVSISFSTSITPPSPLNTFLLSFYSIVVFSHFCTFLCIKECLLSWLNHFKAKNLNRKFWNRKKKKRTSKYNGYKFVQKCYKGIRIAKKRCKF